MVDKVLLVEFRLGEESMVGEFLIINGLPRDGIIGMDILRKINAKIDVEKELLSWKNTHIPWLEGGYVEEIILNNVMIENDNSKNEMEYDRFMEINGDEINNIEDVDHVRIDCPQQYDEFVRNVFKNNLPLVDDTPRSTRYEHTLEVDESKPFKFKNYPVPKCLEDKVQCEINKMLKNDIIERGFTRYINPLLIVRKKCGNIRIVLDARLLNARTKPQFETPLNIDSLLTKCSNAKIFSKVDLRSSYWLVPLSIESRKYCGFLFNGICYRFKRVPFGLASSGAALIRALYEILGPYDYCCTSYVDDILIYSSDVEQHKKHVELIMNVLKENGLKINLEKCEWFKESVEYLSYIIDGKYITVNPTRLEVIKNYPVPKNARSLRGFLGIINYYKRFLPELGNKTEKLFSLLRKNVKFKFDSEALEAFELIKGEFYRQLLLVMPDFSKHFILKVDASDTAISSVLVQMNGEIEEPICFVSRILKKHELSYGVGEKEMLSLVHAVTKLRFYLVAKEFTVQSDHAPLLSIMTTRFVNNRMYRWSLFLSEYNFKIEHVKGTSNIIADALTRMYSHKHTFKYIELNYLDIANAKGVYVFENILRD